MTQDTNKLGQDYAAALEMMKAQQEMMLKMQEQMMKMQEQLNQKENSEEEMKEIEEIKEEGILPEIEIRKIKSVYSDNRGTIEEIRKVYNSDAATFTDNRGTRILVEVPSNINKYINDSEGILEDAITKNSDKILSGYYTYSQVKNMLPYIDVVNEVEKGKIITEIPGGLNFIMTYAYHILNEEGSDVALEKAICVSLASEQYSFITSVVLEHLKYDKNITEITQKDVVESIGEEHLIKFEKNIDNWKKLDIEEALGYTNIKQRSIRNKTISTDGKVTKGGLAGVATGAAVGSVIPIVGTVIGGLIGGAVGIGVTANEVTDENFNAMLDIVYKEAHNLSLEYLLTDKEWEDYKDKFNDKFDVELLENMFKSTNRNEFARKILVKLLEESDIRDYREEIFFENELNAKEILDKIKEVLSTYKI